MLDILVKNARRPACAWAATFVLLEASSTVEVIRTVAQPLLGYKNGRLTFTNSPAVLHQPA
jgi:cytosine deaminase